MIIALTDTYTQMTEQKHSQNNNKTEIYLGKVLTPREKYQIWA